MAHNEFEAVDQAEKLSPSMILMDIQMLEMDDVEAICHLHANPRFVSTSIIASQHLPCPAIASVVWRQVQMNI